ncbi:MAG: hypothetical protein WC976_06190 [Caldisericia bacterium]
MHLYFAHNFNDRKEMRAIELELEKQLGMKLFNPFYDDPTREAEMRELDARGADSTARMSRFKNSFNRDDDDARLIVRRDLQNLAGCDGLFTIVKEPSFGTTIEICNAVLMRKPVYFVSEKYGSHPWIKVYATKTFKDVAEFTAYIQREGK